MRPRKPFSAKFESLGRFLTKRANGSNVSPHKGYSNEQWFQGGLVVKAHRLLYSSTTSLRVIKKKKKKKKKNKKKKKKHTCCFVFERCTLGDAPLWLGHPVA